MKPRIPTLSWKMAWIVLRTATHRYWLHIIQVDCKTIGSENFLNPDIAEAHLNRGKALVGLRQC